MRERNTDISFYEILGIERGASPSAIRAAYRSLMQSPGYHPDRGGDARAAALLNKAYAVLGDPDERSAYDARLDVLSRVAEGFAVDTGPVPDPMHDARVLDPARECVFCESSHGQGSIEDVDASCDTCGSPLTAAQHLRIEPTGQRAVERIGRRLEVRFYTHWQQARGNRARTEDLSLNGLRLVTKSDIRPGQRIRLVSSLLDAVGNVTHCARRPGVLRSHTVAGVAFVTLRFTRPVGSFLSRRV